MSVLILFTVAVLVQLTYWGAFQIGFERARAAERVRRPGPAASPPPPASLVIAARNESAVLPRLLRSIAQQDHPALDVVIVDDASDDDTLAILAGAGDRINTVRITDPVPPRKKHALTAGIAAAESDVLLFTDADCTPKTRMGLEHCELPPGCRQHGDRRVQSVRTPRWSTEQLCTI